MTTLACFICSSGLRTVPSSKLWKSQKVGLFKLLLTSVLGLCMGRSRALLCFNNEAKLQYLCTTNVPFADHEAHREISRGNQVGTKVRQKAWCHANFGVLSDRVSKEVQPQLNFHVDHMNYEPCTAPALDVVIEVILVVLSVRGTCLHLYAQINIRTKVSIDLTFQCDQRWSG